MTQPDNNSNSNSQTFQWCEQAPDMQIVSVSMDGIDDCRTFKCCEQVLGIWIVSVCSGMYYVFLVNYILKKYNAFFKGNSERSG